MRMTESPNDALKPVAEMPLLEHLRELRDRIVKAGIALFIAVVICMMFSNHLIDFLAAPIRQVLSGEQPDNPADLLYLWLSSPLQAVPGWDMLTSGKADGQLTIRGSLEGIYTYMRVASLAARFWHPQLLRIRFGNLSVRDYSSRNEKWLYH